MSIWTLKGQIKSVMTWEEYVTLMRVYKIRLGRDKERIGLWTK